MKLARFWTRAQASATPAHGRPISVLARGWSDESLDAAKARALEVAQRIADLVASKSASKQRYPYGDRPLPEPTLREFPASGGGVSAVVTRNAYGVLVLNADRLMFVDVDRTDAPSRPGSGLGALLPSLLGRSKTATSASQTDAKTLEAMNAVAQRHDLSARIYQTAAGFRLLITSAAYTPGSPEAEALLAEFGSDPLYVRLCRLQDSFRARLTPKPWRCKTGTLPVSFPFDTPRAQERYARWEAEYDAKSASYATCTFIAAIGSGLTLPEFDELIKFHDDQTKATSTLSLA